VGEGRRLFHAKGCAPRMEGWFGMILPAILAVVTYPIDHSPDFFAAIARHSCRSPAKIPNRLRIICRQISTSVL
jgi:hypothetical protein